jgi:hypothetical protein
MESSPNETNTTSLPPQAQPPPPPQPSTPQVPLTKPAPTRKPRQRKQAELKARATTSSTGRESPRLQSTTLGLPVLTMPPADQVQSPSRGVRGPPQPATPLQPYPPPTYHVMNPGYPMNSLPYAQHQPNYPPHPPPMPINGASGPGTPGHHPQYYPMHPSPYPPPHAYPYPPYPQQMMMYGAPRSQFPPEMQGAPPPMSASPQQAKRKRKSVGDQGDQGSDDDSIPSGTDMHPQQLTSHQMSAPPPTAVDMKKRTKTQRACDSCRSRKIR